MGLMRAEADVLSSMWIAPVLVGVVANEVATSDEEGIATEPIASGNWVRSSAIVAGLVAPSRS